MNPPLARWLALPALALSCLIACPPARAGVGGAGPPGRADLERLATLAGLSGEAARQRLQGALDAVDPGEVHVLSHAEGRLALADALGAEGVPAPLREALVDQVIEALGGPMPQPLLQVGSFSLSPAQARFVAGPREGRDRAEVALRLAQTAPADAAALGSDELLAHVPLVVEAAESLLSREALVRIARALTERGGEQ